MTSLRKRERQIQEYVEALCQECTIEVGGSGHLKVLMQGPNGKKLVVASRTPSDGRGELNMFAMFRRVARELGCVPA